MSWRRCLGQPAAPLTALLLASTLASCAPLTRSVVQAPAPPPPESLLRPCDPPRRLPAEGLSPADVARLWGRDRLALAVCGARHGALARYGRSLARLPDG